MVKVKWLNKKMEKNNSRGKKKLKRFEDLEIYKKAREFRMLTSFNHLTNIKEVT